MNKFIAFVGGVVIGTVYSKQIKELYKEVQSRSNEKATERISGW